MKDCAKLASIKRRDQKMIIFLLLMAECNCNQFDYTSCVINNHEKIRLEELTFIKRMTNLPMMSERIN